MTPGTDVALKDSDQELVDASNAVAEQLAAAQEAEYDNDTLSTPILKVGQALTAEVTAGDAEAGEFINTLTGETLGDAVEFIVSYYNKGRFASKDNRAYVAFGSEIPDTWADLVGEEWIGSPFAEHPDAEETYKQRVNDKEIEWGKGPLISTTHNFTGYVIGEDEDGDADYQPVRLSLKRTDKKAAEKINTLHRMKLRNKPKWDAVLSLATAKKAFGRYESFIIDPAKIKIVRDTTPEEKALGAELALAVSAGRTRSEGAEDALTDRATEPTADGALAV